MSILTKTTTTGQQLEVSMSSSHVRQLAVSLDGKALCSGWLEPLRQPKGDVTHHIGGKAGFTTAEATVIETAFRAACVPSVADQRSALCATLLGLQDEQNAAFARGHESDGSTAYRAAEQWEARLEAARQALTAFDAAHANE